MELNSANNKTTMGKETTVIETSSNREYTLAITKAIMDVYGKNNKMSAEDVILATTNALIDITKFTAEFRGVKDTDAFVLNYLKDITAQVEAKAKEGKQ